MDCTLPKMNSQVLPTTRARGDVTFGFHRLPEAWKALKASQLQLHISISLCCCTQMATHVNLQREEADAEQLMATDYRGAQIQVMKGGNGWKCSEEQNTLVLLFCKVLRGKQWPISPCNVPPVPTALHPSLWLQRKPGVHKRRQLGKTFCYDGQSLGF